MMRHRYFDTTLLYCDDVIINIVKNVTLVVLMQHYTDCTDETLHLLY